MKIKLIDLQNQRLALYNEAEEMVKIENMDEDQKTAFDAKYAELEEMDKTIERYEKQAKLDSMKVAETVVEEVVETQSLSEAFQEFIKTGGKEVADEYRSPNGGFMLYADPILTSTDTGVINKTVANSLDILTSPGEAFLRKLGVTFYPGLTGNFVVPAMAEDTAAFVAEDASGASANMAPESLTLAARRVTHDQMITKETLAQTNPAIYTGIMQNLVDGVWNAITNDVFDTLETDAASSVYTSTVAGLTYGDIVGLEASIGGLNIGAGAYVTTPSGKAYLKQTVVLGTDNGPIWANNEVNGYPAYGVPAANAGAVYFGDFSRMAVGQWGGIEIIVDPYTKAKQGRIVLTAVALADTGCTNGRALAWTDASMGV